MPNTTPVYGLPFPEDTDPTDVPGDLEALALAVEADLVAMDGRVDTLEADTGWVNCTTRAGFTNQEQPQVRRIRGVVYARGGWSNGGMATNGTYNVGDVPAGFRPTNSQPIRWGTSTGATAGAGFVLADGTIQVRTSGTLSAYYLFASQSWLLG